MENCFFSIPEWIIIMPYWLVEKYSIFPTIDDKNKIVAGIMGKKSCLHHDFGAKTNTK